MTSDPSPAGSDRYSRQILFSPIGQRGQERIQAASLAVVGCGALGSFQAEALARAGVGRITIIDRDYVDFSNLQRQWLFEEADAVEEKPKAIAAAERIRRLNSQVEVLPHVSDLTPSNVEELLAGCEVILDGTDNFETRYLLNDYAVKFGVPWIYGAAIGSYGITMPVIPSAGPCFACVYPEAPTGIQPTCDVDGVIASATAGIAAQQVALALKLIVGRAEEIKPRITSIDYWTQSIKQVNAGSPDPECSVCGKREFRFLDGQRKAPVSLCGRNAVQLHEVARPLNLSQLADRLRTVGEVRVNDFALRLSIPKYDLTFFPDGRAIVKGTTDVGLARSLYTRLIGG